MKKSILAALVLLTLLASSLAAQSPAGSPAPAPADDKASAGSLVPADRAKSSADQNSTDTPGSAEKAAPAPGDMDQILKQALKVHIQARIYQDVQNVMWESDVDKLTISGRPVTINMQNEKSRIAVHFTPYRTVQGGLILIAQSEIWLKEPSPEDDQKGKIRYFTSMRSIPLDFDELIYFYPLGRLENLDNPNQIHIEMALKIAPYSAESDGGQTKASAEGH